MKYMGSKSRIVGNILPIIQERLRNYNIKTYIEPFCGGCNVIDKVQCDTKIASDNHKYQRTDSKKEEFENKIGSQSH